MNLNSAFADRFEFTGGIAVNKHEDIDEKQYTDIFKWNSNQYVEETWREIFTETTDLVEVHDEIPVYVENTYTTTTAGYETYLGYRIGNWTSSTSITDSREFYGDANVHNKTVVNLDARNSLFKSENHYGAAIENAKYSNVENWASTFEPIMIKLKIN